MIRTGALMSRRYQGVIVPLESFIEKVRLPTMGFASLRFNECRVNPSKLKRFTEWLEFMLVVKLLEDQFLLHVEPRHGTMPWISRPDLMAYINDIKQHEPDYEILFGCCFHSHLLSMRSFPDMVYLKKLNDSIAVTWKPE